MGLARASCSDNTPDVATHGKGAAACAAQERLTAQVEEFRDSGDHVEFGLVVRHPCGMRWKVWRRFTAFEDTHLNLMKATNNDPRLPSLPSKGWMPHFMQVMTTSFCKQRSAELQGYLDSLLSVNAFAMQIETLDLLGMRSPEPPAGLRVVPRHGHSRGHTQEYELEIRPSKDVQDAPVESYNITINVKQSDAVGSVPDRTFTCVVGNDGLSTQVVQLGRLQIGENEVVVTASNLAGESSAESVTIIVGVARSDGCLQAREASERHSSASAAAQKPSSVGACQRQHQQPQGACTVVQGGRPQERLVRESGGSSGSHHVPPVCAARAVVAHGSAGPVSVSVEPLNLNMQAGRPCAVPLASPSTPRAATERRSPLSVEVNGASGHAGAVEYRHAWRTQSDGHAPTAIGNVHRPPPVQAARGGPSSYPVHGSPAVRPNVVVRHSMPAGGAGAYSGAAALHLRYLSSGCSADASSAASASPSAASSSSYSTAARNHILHHPRGMASPEPLTRPVECRCGFKFASVQALEYHKTRCDLWRASSSPSNGSSEASAPRRGAPVAAGTVSGSVSGDDRSESEAINCVICMAADKTHAFVPCGHRCVCADCGKAVLKGGAAQCPLCRASVADVIHVFD